jgi:predicted RNase H-like HicB family nuclease
MTSFYCHFVDVLSRMVRLKFAVIVEKDEAGYYVASVPELPGCHTQAKTLDELMVRVKEAIEAYLEAEGYKPKEGVELVALQFVEVSAQ